MSPFFKGAGDRRIRTIALVATVVLEAAMSATGHGIARHVAPFGRVAAGIPRRGGRGVGTSRRCEVARRTADNPYGTGRRSFPCASRPESSRDPLRTLRSLRATVQVSLIRGGVIGEWGHRRAMHAWVAGGLVFNSRACATWWRTISPRGKILPSPPSPC